jgi:hypothetical protein
VAAVDLNALTKTELCALVEEMRDAACVAAMTRSESFWLESAEERQLLNDLVDRGLVAFTPRDDAYLLLSTEAGRDAVHAALGLVATPGGSE